ncbi:hypothetical protein Fmac_013931 [Flemingia macrophylla]|uniref:RRM domain-containing protein n=1 Tax=Flemingia macrophylla TaxID=520843 RepID=A0ABD1MB21_9FABA
MGEAGVIVRLDPKAQEFIPTTTNNNNPIPFHFQWYPCPCPCPCPWPFPLPSPSPSPSPSWPLPSTPMPPVAATSTRSLLLTPVPPAAQSAVVAQLQALGQLRGLQAEALRLTVHFFDLRHAESAFNAFHMHPARPISAHYLLPSPNAPFPDPHNQGTLHLFNLDPSFSSPSLRRLFQPFGPIKELRHTPGKKNQRFVEFFDVRDAATAFKHLNGKRINGNPLLIHFTAHTHTHTNPSPKSPSPSAKSPSPSNSHSRRKHNSVTPKQHCSKGKHHPKKHDARFLIKEDAAVDHGGDDSSPADTRTTLMIKNIPNKYSQKLLLNMLDNHCIHCNEHINADQPLSSYDFLYLPIDFNNKCNVGYGFVNMTTPQATLRLYKAFHLQHWEVFNSRKICQVTYARVQGLEALKEHFKNSKFPCEMEHYLPVVFSPPRDGRELTEPLPIVGNKQNHAILITPVPSVVAASDDDEGKCDYDDDEDETKEEMGGNL